jgi:hypothetical protein
MRTAVQNKMGKNGHKYKRSIYVGIKMGFFHGLLY